VGATPKTLSDYLAESPGREVRVLIEHARCGRPLGEHRAKETELGTALSKSLGGRYVLSARRQAFNTSSSRGPESTPGIRGEPFDGEPYMRCYCVCLPKEHAEKRRLSKLGALPVTFPTWKWGRPIDLPVVTF
jgi:hypothetical protein